MGFWDFVILAAVAAMVGLAIFVLTRRKKEGKGSCGACEHCAGCPVKEQKENEPGLPPCCKAREDSQ